MLQEESVWFQKSRCNCIRHGDRDTRYFHAMTVAGRMRNKVRMLMNEDGEWIKDDEVLKCMASDFYKRLYTSKGAGQVLASDVGFLEIDKRVLN